MSEAEVDACEIHVAKVYAAEIYTAELHARDIYAREAYIHCKICGILISDFSKFCFWVGVSLPRSPYILHYS
jgi:hypothetical protein